MKRSLLCLFLLAACGSDEPPSCQQAVGVWFAAGCSVRDAEGNDIPETEVVLVCRQYLNCGDAFEDWVRCLEAADGCECSREQEELARVCS